jgi:hypothetical protein
VQVRKWGLSISSALWLMEYIHLSNSTPGTRKKCCVNGRLSSASDNFNEDLMMGYVLDELPVFVRTDISNSNKFSQKSSTYNNLVAMAATVVCNYNETAGFSRRGPGPQSVFMNGRVHHYIRIASSTSQNCPEHLVALGNSTTFRVRK